MEHDTKTNTPGLPTTKTPVVGVVQHGLKARSSIFSQHPSHITTTYPRCATVPAITRSRFAPFPRGLPPSATSFAVDFTSETQLIKKSKHPSASLSVAIFIRVLDKHATSYTSVTCSSSSSPSPAASSLISAYVNTHIDNIEHINLVKSRGNSPSRYSFYINTTTPDACIQLRHAITSYTKLTCRDITERIIVGKVFPIPYHKKTEDILAEICRLVPSFTLTRAIHAPPSTHPYEHVYWSVGEKELQQLVNIRNLVGSASPLTWQRMTRPKEVICSLCFQDTHWRSKCEHLLSGKQFCANCGSDTHLARSCTAPRHCFCCGEMNHIIFDCENYKPQYKTISPSLNPADFPKLTPTSTYSSVSSTRLAPTPSSTTHWKSSLSSSSPTDSHRAQHKRARHTSFDADSIDDYESRENRMVSPRFQQELDMQSLTRRTQTPSPSRSVSRSSSRSSLREMQLEQQLIQVQQENKSLQQQLQVLTEQVKQLLDKLSTTTNTTPTTKTLSSSSAGTSGSHMHD
jgi:hypothetical protein